VRIVAGKFGGRRLSAEVAAGTRPTSDRVREGLGSALAARGAFEGAHVLDLFSGTGALALEAVSRGAALAVAVDNDKRALACMRENVAALGAGEQVQIVALDLLKSEASVAARLREKNPSPYGLVFADPPYAHAARMPGLIAALREAGALHEQALVVLEHASDFALENQPHFETLGRYRYGDTSVTLLARVS
jgi:16S rRNA (guanine966-N2)-methyltransferase